MNFDRNFALHLHRNNYSRMHCVPIHSIYHLNCCLRLDVLLESGAKYPYLLA